MFAVLLWYATVQVTSSANVFGTIDMQSITDLGKGFKIFGSETYAELGTSVGGGHSCDVNGDGFDDIVVAGLGGGQSQGIAYVLLGHNATKLPFNDITTSLSITSAQGFTIYDPSGANKLQVACAGDFNKDGIADIVIGVPDAVSDQGYAFVIYGRRGAQSNINLNSITSSLGFKINGWAGTSNKFGFSVDRAGDVNGDGYGDVIISSPYAMANSLANAGVTYVLFGAAASTTFAISSFSPGALGFNIFGSVANAQCGLSASGAGDINNDGYADVIVGCPGEDGNGRGSSGVAYALFGRASYVSGVNLASYATAMGFRIIGSYNDNLGVAVSRAGDVNHDGVADFFVGSNTASYRSTSNPGAGYVIFGQLMPYEPSRVIDTQNYVSGITGFAIYGTSNSLLGVALSDVGDFNGDGIDDVVITSTQMTIPSRGGAPGTAFVIFGHSNQTMFSTVDLSMQSYGSWGFQLIGETSGGLFGCSVRSAGDFNKDGFMDLLIGASNMDSSTSAISGMAYVLFGNAGWAAPTAAPTRPVVLSDKSFTNHDLVVRNAGVDSIMISGGASADSLGEHTNHGQSCDVNGDGIHDLLICSTMARGGGGAAYVIYGHTAASLPFIDFTLTDSLDPSQGYKISTVSDAENFGSACSCAGDVNGDGIDDFVIGASTRAYVGNLNAGAAYVLYGRRGITTTIASLVTGPSTGFMIATQDANSYLGSSVDGAGDFNNDGYADVVLGAPTLNGAGSVTVIFGGPITRDIVMSGSSSLTGIGFRIVGVESSGRCGAFVSGVGKFNIDVYSDIAIGCPGAGGGNGTAYVYLGRAVPSDYYLSNGFPITVGQTILGSTGSALGRVSRVGDINHDGLDDVMVGAPQAYNSMGAVVVVFGKSNPVFSTVYLYNLHDFGQSLRAFGIFGQGQNFRVGTSLGRLGDYNGDGIDDIVVSGPGASDPFQGRGATGLTYVILGRTAFTNIWLTDMQVTSSQTGFLVIGKAPGDNFGIQAHGAGDFNHDGLMDLLLSASTGNSASMSGNGQVYVMFGRTGVVVPTLQPSRSPTASPTASPSAIPTYTRTSSPVYERPTADIDLTLYSNTQVTGISYYGYADSVNFGNSVKDIGDFNLDGKPDVIIGSYANDQAGGNYGAAYIVFGGITLENYDFNGFVSGSRGIRIFGNYANGYLGYSVSGAGDFNNDGFADVIVGAYNSNYGSRSASGTAYIIFGHGAPYVDVFMSSFASGSLGVVIGGGWAGDFAGYSVSGVGDYNGDGISDVAVGAMYTDQGNSGTDSGSVYVIFGRSAIMGDIDLSSFPSANTEGFRIYGGTSSAFLGYSVSGAGDVNGDGRGDLIIGSQNWNSGQGCAYVMLGRTTTSVNNLDMTNFGANTYGFRIIGAAVGNQLGYSVSGAGDINGDGYDDVLVGAPGLSYSTRSSCGAVFVIFGQNYLTVGTMPDISVSGLGANSYGYAIFGEQTNDQLGRAVGRAYDVSRDGIADIIIGAPQATRGGLGTKGVAYVIFGNTRAPAVVDLTILGTAGYRLVGSNSNDQAGFSVSGARDFNQDGYNDIMIGAMGATVNGQSNRGRVYFIYGSAVNPTSQPSSRPSRQPSSQPSRQPSRQPSSQPSTQPSMQPTSQPSSHPSRQPSAQPSSQPVGRPTAQPSGQPTSQPSSRPSSQPSGQPLAAPTSQPSSRPSGQPSAQPSAQPVGRPSAQPTGQPTRQPSSRPSAQPSGQPVSAPSTQPSAQPSSQPSSRPTSQPSRQPSTSPTNQPSSRPSAQPSSQPSSRPTSQPSRQPSTSPTSQPSNHPSAQPSRQPTSHPSTQPTRQPSSSPTSHPSSHPSSQPSGQPTLQPTTQPSACPSRQPSVQPSSQPSEQPVGRPSSQPSVAPSAQPSALPTSPTSRPTGQPSIQPTSVPSGQPSARPSSVPSSQPSGLPTVDPSAQPSAEPSTQPSSRPSAVPSALPSAQPSSLPSTQPSAVPSSQPSSIPSAQPSGEPSVQPSSTPSAQPSSQPSTRPSSQPSRQPSAQPTSQPTAQPSTYPTIMYNASVEMNTIRAAPNITSMVITGVNRTTLSVSVMSEGRLESLVYCGAFASASYNLLSTNEIVNQNVMSYSVNGLSTLDLSNLYPSTDYTVYCMTASLQGTRMSFSNAVRNVAHTHTLCCKTLTANLLASSVYVGKSTQNAVSVVYDVPPSVGLTVSVSFTSTSLPAVIPATTSYPSSLTLLASDSLKAARLLRLVAGGQDSVEMVVTLSGPSASEYSVRYTNERRAVRVISLNVEPPLPVLQLAQFSNDGGSVVLTFDSPTDKAGYNNVFPCGALLTFSGADTATCQWMDSSNVVVYPKYTGGAPVVTVDSDVTLSAGLLHARCTSNVTELCSAWSAMPSSSIKVLRPANPSAPVVSFPLPSTVSACNSLLIDLTASSGAAGRPWSSVTIKVLTSGGQTVAATLLQHFLDANFTYSPPTVVPSSVLTPGYLFSIQATMCNYLGACGVAVRTVTVLMAPAQVPITSINGQKQRNVYRSAALMMNGVAFTQTCGDTVSYTDLEFSWAVYLVAADGSTSITTLRSVSQNAAVFKLAPYSLIAGSVYNVVLTAKSSISGLQSTATTTVTVLSGDVVAKIAQGAVLSMEADSFVALDAAGSSDQDITTLTGWSAGLSFAWACEQVEPVFSPNCSFIASTLSAHGDFNTIRASADAVGSTFRFTVTVYDSTRSNSAYTDVTVTAAPQSDLRIANSVASVTSVDSNSALTLLGSLKVHAACTAAWSVDDSSLNLAAVARTAITKSIVPALGSAYVPFNLVIAGGVLAQRASFAFTLQCGESSAVVTVTTNGAPLPGEFLVTPTTGVELSTSFLFTAVQWSDPDLPITYQFGYQSISSQSNLVIVGATEKSYSNSLLPAGSDAHENSLNCSLYVFDSFAASSQVILNITVNPISLENKDSAIVALFESNTGSVDDAKRILSVASAALNQANCSAAPNCTSLHRSPCAKSSGECGACMAGYVGTGGDSNQACIAVSTLSSPLLGSTCNSTTQCESGQLCDLNSGVCTFPTKICSRECSGHGFCQLTSIASGQRVTNCTVIDTSCTALCSCVEGFSGRACEINSTSLSTNRAFRTHLLDTLQNLTATEDVNAQSVSDWSASLYALALNPFELSQNDIGRMMQLANGTITYALEVGVTDHATVLGVLQATDSAASVSGASFSSNLTSSALHNNTAGDLVTVVSAFADLVTQSQAYGENATVFLYDNFRMSAGLYELSANTSSLTVQSPLSAAEISLGTRASSATLRPTLTSAADAVVALKVVDVHPQAYAADTSSFVSNPLYLQLSANDGRSALDVVSGLTFEFEHNEAVPQYEFHQDVNFTSECLGLGAGENYTFICPSSGVQLVNHCKKGPGVYVLNCPKLTPGCAQVGLYNSEVDILSSCKVTDYSATHTTCQCSLNGTASAQSSIRSRRLADTFEHQVLSETGVSNMLATSSYVVMEFADTFNAAKKFDSPDSVVIVIYMFATLWGAGLLILSVCLTKGYVSKREKAKQVSNKVAVATAVLAGPSSDVAQSKRVLLDYIDGVLPSVYDETKSSMGRMLGELRAHHRYLSVFTLGDGQISLNGKFLIIGKLLTVETMQMFVLAMLYDLQGPENDGSCVHHYTEAACLSRKSIFDNDVTYCEWTNDPAAGGTNCFYHREQFTFKIALYILVLTSIFSSIFATPLDYLFKVCSAPRIDKALHAQVAKNVARRTTVASGIRRMSALSVSAVRAARRSTIAARNAVVQKTQGIRSFFMPSNPADHVIANREISEDVEHLHIQARAVLPSVSVNSETLRRKKHAAALHMKNKAMSRRMHMSESDSDLSEATIDRDSFDHQNAVRAADATNPEKSEKPKGTAASRLSLRVLCEEVIAQRELMPKDSMYTSEFDNQWGIQTTVRPASMNRTSALGNYKYTYSISEEAQSDILESIIISDEQAAELNEQMPRYTLHHGGLAVLNMFVLDLLGRTTSAAKIFRNKFEEDFEQTKAVSRWYQALAVAILLGCNGFFIYYSLLKAFQKGTTWQYKYLQGCIVQMLVELFLNETIECIWLNFIVPDLVRKEVKKATIVINKVVEQITESANARSGRSILFLDAAPYLFSSTKVAQAHPNLLESIVVLNYQSHLPGELSKTWPHCAQVASASQRYADRLANEGKTLTERIYLAVPTMILAVSTYIVLTLQGLGTMSFGVQRTVLRLIQPSLLSGLTLLWFFASKSTLGLVLMIVVTSLFVAAFAWRQHYVHKLERALQNSAAPFDDTVFFDKDGDFEDVESVPNSPRNTAKDKERAYLSLHGSNSDTHLKAEVVVATPISPKAPPSPVKKAQIAFFDTSSSESTGEGKDNAEDYFPILRDEPLPISATAVQEHQSQSELSTRHRDEPAINTVRSRIVSFDSSADSVSSIALPPTESGSLRRRTCSTSQDIQEEPKAAAAAAATAAPVAETPLRAVYAQYFESKEEFPSEYEPRERNASVFARELSMKHSFSFIDDEPVAMSSPDNVLAQELSMKHSFSFVDNEEVHNEMKNDQMFAENHDRDNQFAQELYMKRSFSFADSDEGTENSDAAVSSRTSSVPARLSAALRMSKHSSRDSRVNQQAAADAVAVAARAMQQLPPPKSESVKSDGFEADIRLQRSFSFNDSDADERQSSISGQNNANILPHAQVTHPKQGAGGFGTSYFTLDLSESESSGSDSD